MASNLPGADMVDVDRGPIILAACLSSTILAVISVAGRIWVRVTMVKSVAADDYMIILSSLLSISGMGIVIAETYCGAGRHSAFLPPNTVELRLKLSLALQPIYLFAISSIKISVALFLLRFARSKAYRRFLWGMIVFLVLYTVVNLILLTLECQNMAVMWDPSIVTTCWAPGTMKGLGYLANGINILTDLLFALVPIPMLWNVQIRGSLKAGICLILGLGLFGSLAAIIKLSYLINYDATGDLFWNSANIISWTTTEFNTGIIAACLPCLKPLFKQDNGRSHGTLWESHPSSISKDKLGTFEVSPSADTLDSLSQGQPQDFRGHMRNASSVTHVSAGKRDSLDEKAWKKILGRSVVENGRTMETGVEKDRDLEKNWDDIGDQEHISSAQGIKVMKTMEFEVRSMREGSVIEEGGRPSQASLTSRDSWHEIARHSGIPAR